MIQKIKEIVSCLVKVSIVAVISFCICIMIYWTYEDTALFNAVQFSLNQNSSCDLTIESLNITVIDPVDTDFSTEVSEVLRMKIALDKKIDEINSSSDVLTCINQIRYTVQAYINTRNIFSKYSYYKHIELWICSKDDSDSKYEYYVGFSTLYNTHLWSTFGFPEDEDSRTSKVLDSLQISSYLQNILDSDSINMFSYAKSLILYYDMEDYEFLANFTNLKYLYVSGDEETIEQIKNHLPSKCIIYYFDASHYRYVPYE